MNEQTTPPDQPGGSESLHDNSKAQQFQLLAFWRHDDWIQAVRSGENPPFNVGAYAHNLDSLDLFLRGYLIGKQNDLRFTNTQIRYLLALGDACGDTPQQVYNMAYTVFLLALNELVEFELYRV